MNYTIIDSSPSSRKPRVLRHMTIKTNSFHKTLLKQATQYYLGSVHTAYPEENDLILDSLRKICNLHGFEFKRKNSKFCYPSGYIYGAGSVEPHYDNSFGLSLGVLVATQNMTRTITTIDNCFLFASNKVLTINVGVVFLFNSDARHAWMANCRWVIASQSVRIKRAIAND